MSNPTLQSCMSEQLQAACESVLPGAVFPQLYTGGLLKYIVWDYNQIPQVFAERAPHAARYLVQVHFYLPHKENPQAAILALSRALFEKDFTWPTVTDATDSDGQHWVLECEYADGGGYYGFA